MARRWSAVLARLGTPTGDGRILTPGGITARDLPLPLMWQERTEDGHGGSLVVGRIETIRFDDGMVTATGSMLDSAEWGPAMEQIEAGIIGPSVDLDDVDYVADDAGNMIITRGRISGATLVAIPAFAGVSITLDPLPAHPVYPDHEGYPAEAMTYYAANLAAFSVRTGGWSSLPIADASHAWDGGAAADRVFAWAGGPDNISWSKYARAFLRKDDDANPETRGAYGFGVADIVDGELTIIPKGVFAAAAAVQGARTGQTPEDAEGMKRVLRSLYKRMDREAPFSLTASAASGPQRPPAAWFTKPDVDRLTPLTVSDTGRVFGHIAGWGTSHVGLPGDVKPPRSRSGYANFHTAAQITEDGETLAVGVLVTGPRHADPQLAFRAAAQHYDDLDSAVAKVVAGEDEFGIWVAGWVLPGADSTKIEQFMTTPVSGDWRYVGGSLDLIAVCSVNVPGFPVPRVRGAFAAGAQRALIASFGITPVRGEWVQATHSEASFVKTVPAGDLARARWSWAVATTESE